MPDESRTSRANLILGAILLCLSALSIAALATGFSGNSGLGPLSSLGSSLSEAFSWAGLFLPLWLASAALVAFLPGWRPASVAALAGSVLPFLPIAAIARLGADPDSFLSERPYLSALGEPLLVAMGLALALVFTAFVALISRSLARLEASALLEESPSQPRRVLLPPPWEARTEEAGEEGLMPGREDGAFDFHVPELPPLSPLLALGESFEQALETSLEQALETSLEPGLETSPEPPSAPADEAPLPEEPLPALSLERVELSPIVAPIIPAAEKGVALAEPELREPAVAGDDGLALSLDGKHPIPFISVPSQHSQTEEAAKEAALGRILALRARRKDKPYAVPSDGILTSYPDGEYWIVDEKTKKSAVVLRDTLAEFKIEAEVTGIRKGPVITMFEILPAPGVKLSKITNLADNIALRLAASSVRIVAPIPGKHAVGIEVPNERRSIVSLREIVENDLFKTAKMEIPIILGKDIAGEPQFIDLTQTPHLLIAGATGSGKSVSVNSIILSILYRRSPQEVKLLLIDPKIVELKLYNGIGHLLTPVITEPKRAFQALQYCICEMERRYSLLDQVGVRDIKSYNRKIKDKALVNERLPYIVVIIDEFADLMATTGKELESTLARLAAMSRAVGIHLVLATQRPSIDVITGLIKANIPSRIAFMVASKFDSRIIIDVVGAEKLLGRGDMLVATAWDPFPIRMQGAYVSEEEVERAVEFVKTLGEPDYIDDEIFFDDEDEDAEPSLFGDEDDDPLFEKALEIVLQQGKASASYIQRRLKIGYNRASRLVELMEEKGIVGPAKGSKPRDLMHNPEVLGRVGAGAGAGPGARQQSLIPELETVPGQRVTGRDEDAGDEDAGDEDA